MKTVKRTDGFELLAGLEQYGYSLMRPLTTSSPEQVLKELVHQDDARLLEGFPVVVVNALRKTKKLAWESPSWKPEKEFTQKEVHRLAVLFMVTDILVHLFGLQKECGNRAMQLAVACKGFQLMKALPDQLLKSESVQLDQLELSSERLKTNFRNYVVHGAESVETQRKQKVLELELLLSQLFTPRQKELLNKRLQNKPMNKTEQQYFYRVVKKRLKALASPELHQMARQVLS